MAGEDFSFIGDAIVSIAPYGTTTFRDIGNCSAGSFSHSLEKISKKNYRDGTGGERNSRTRIESVQFALTMDDYYPDNIAIWTAGTVSDSGADKVIDALTNIGGFWIVKVAGKNTAQNEDFEVNIFRSTIDPADNLPFITAGQYAEANTVINILSDESIVSGSKFYNIIKKAYTGP